MAKITDRQMTAKPGTSDKWLSEVAIWGHGSLVARITPSGERLFYFRYTNGGSERITLPIGTYSRDGSEGTMTLAEAGQRAKELAGLHKSGVRVLALMVRFPPLLAAVLLACWLFSRLRAYARKPPE